MSVFKAHSHPSCYLWNMLHVFGRAPFWMLSPRKHLPTILWEQKALSLAVYRWLVKNKREVWARLNWAAAENSNKWSQTLLFPRVLLWKMPKWDVSQAHAVCQSSGEKENLSHFHLPASLEVGSLSAIVTESFLVFRFQPWSRGLWWAFYFLSWKGTVWTMKWRLSLASVRSVRWGVSIHTMNNAHISTFDFPSIDFSSLVYPQWGKVWLSKFSRLSRCIFCGNKVLWWRTWDFSWSQAGPKSLCYQHLHPKEVKTKNHL